MAPLDLGKAASKAANLTRGWRPCSLTEVIVG